MKLSVRTADSLSKSNILITIRSGAPMMKTSESEQVHR